MSILVVTKNSKYDWERKKLNLTHDELIAKYNKEHANLDAILASHEQQVKMREILMSALPDAETVMMSDIQDVAAAYGSADSIIPANAELVLVLGGDNSFTYVSHFVNTTPVLGINSDPGRSVGCLTRWSLSTDEDVFNLVEMLDFEEYSVEEWTRLKATVDGRHVMPATSEYFFGERQRNFMSRHVLVHNGKEIEQKCSGILFSTGAGSTGWHRSSTGKIPWSPTEPYAAYAATEMYNSLQPGQQAHGILTPSDSVTLYSLNDNEGLLSIDSWQEHPFNRGSEAVISLGSPLRVVCPHE